MSQTADRWLLPAGIEELLPPQAAFVEQQRRAVIDLFSLWGYELVVTPFVEYLESLLTGTGPDLDLRTFKLIDQLTGRSMGIRADMTPQVARIDAHHLERPGPVRLCYIGTVLHTLPGGFSASRTPLQMGAELYGHAGVQSDCEIVCLMLATLERVGVHSVHLDIGHMGIFRGLVTEAELDVEVEARLFDALQRKAGAEVELLLNEPAICSRLADMFGALVELNGGESVLTRARRALAGANEEVQQSLSRLEALAAALRQRMPEVDLNFDLAELRGYRYERGVVFAAFVPGRGEEIARGGRYDGIGEAFGRARPAIGFSTDLRTLVSVGGLQPKPVADAVFAPWSDDPSQHREVESLRGAGVRVVQGFPDDSGEAAELGCSRRLLHQDGAWVIVDSAR